MTQLPMIQSTNWTYMGFTSYNRATVEMSSLSLGLLGVIPVPLDYYED